MLADGEFGHAVAIGRSLALRGRAAERDVDAARVQFDLPLDVLEPPFNEVGFFHDRSLGS
jgi:hypothetical protein